MAKIRKWKPSMLLVLMVILELVVVVWSYEGSKALYGTRLNNEYNQLQRAWRLRGRRGRGRGHNNRQNGESRRSRFEWERVESRPEKSRPNKRLNNNNPNKEVFIIESVESCCPTVFEMVEPVAGRNRTGHLVELYRDENVRQRFYEVSCRPGVVDKPCKFLENRHSKFSTCIQQFSFTYALVRPPDHHKHLIMHGEQPWSLDYISIRSGCACQVNRRRKKHQSEF